MQPITREQLHSFRVPPRAITLWWLGQTGFLVNNVSEAAQAVNRLGDIDRNACRQRVRECFSIETMVMAYERVYTRIFEMEAAKPS